MSKKNSSLIISKKIKSICIKKNRFKFLNHNSNYIIVVQPFKGKKIYMRNPNVNVITQILFTCNTVIGNEPSEKLLRKVFKQINSSLKSNNSTLYLNLWLNSERKIKYIRATTIPISSNIMQYINEKNQNWLPLNSNSNKKMSFIELIKAN